MAWKPKEKQLTAEEAIALARKELAPLWFGSPPLLAGVRAGGRSSAHPLDENFQKKHWITLFVDATTFSGLSAISFLREWRRRYGLHDLGFLLFLKFPYPHVYSRQSIEDFLLHPNEIDFPVAIDPDGSVFEAFGATTLPKQILLAKGKPIFDFSGPNWSEKGEAELQKFLRATDPGLPLLQVLKTTADQASDLANVEFAHPAPGQIQLVETLPPVIPEGKIFLTGKWQKEPNGIICNDPHATVTFRCPGHRLGLLARSYQKTLESGFVSVEINGVAVYENFFGAQMTRDEESRTVIKTGQRWFYEIAQGLPESDRLVTLRLPGSEQIPITLYGLRFGR